MFNKSIDDRLSSWAQHRSRLESAEDPLSDVWEFWKNCPFIPYNNSVDPFYPRGWPTPWEIIVENKYDDFTKALMIAKTLKLTKRFKDSTIDIRICVDEQRHTYYNIVCIDNVWAINFDDQGPVSYRELLDKLLVENVIEVDI